MEGGGQSVVWMKVEVVEVISIGAAVAAGQRTNE